MKYLIRIANVIIGAVLISSTANAQGIDYTTRNLLTHSCVAFANDALQAADIYAHDVMLQEVLEQVENAKMAETKKHRAFQAIQFVWKNQIDNPTLAYSLAMGLCLKPKQQMAPMDEPWRTSPRTSKEFF